MSDTILRENSAVRRAPDSYRAHGRPAWQRVLFTRESAIIGLLVVVILVALATVRNFDSPLTVTYLLLDVAPILLIALPMTLIIVSEEIDLSVASTVGLSSVIVGILTQAGLPFEATALVALFVGVIAGALNGFLITVVGLPSLAVTIGTLALFRGIAVGLLGTTAITDFPEFWTDLAQSRIPGTPVPSIVIPIVVLAVAFAILLHFTSFGRGIYAIGLNKEAAAFSGVHVDRTKFLLFVSSGLVSAFAGIFFTLRFGNARGDNAIGLELSIIAAVLLGGVSIFGGRGAIHGVIAGVLLIGTLGSALRLANVTSDVINVITGVLLVLSVVSTSVLRWVRSKRLGSAGKSRKEVPASSG
ncbi:ABC transporter permease [Salinibacterium sp. ZJ450]|uniref:ABC transporter permease n=1 Tax=Salinibacterium sp. ZJ450 TaxID=2708338 RepID=UPI0014202822|nr:ABC transporter permease [Salinibacterium sp. ZJ450]